MLIVIDCDQVHKEMYDSEITLLSQWEIYFVF